jgi:hypothetical protein
VASTRCSSSAACCAGSGVQHEELSRTRLKNHRARFPRVAISCAKIRLTRKTGGDLAPQPEKHARSNIDRLLAATAWHACDTAAANICIARRTVIIDFIQIDRALA